VTPVLTEQALPRRASGPPLRRQVGERRRTFGTGPFTRRQVVPWYPLKPVVLVPTDTAGNSFPISSSRAIRDGSGLSLVRSAR
jgi:hypothetical protein